MTRISQLKMAMLMVAPLLNKTTSLESKRPRQQQKTCHQAIINQWLIQQQVQTWAKLKRRLMRNPGTTVNSSKTLEALIQISKSTMIFLVVASLVVNFLRLTQGTMAKTWIQLMPKECSTLTELAWEEKRPMKTWMSTSTTPATLAIFQLIIH